MNARQEPAGLNLQSSPVHLAVPIEDASYDEAINSWCVKMKYTDKETSNGTENENGRTI